MLKALDVGIGLGLVYMLLSLVVSSIQEMWAALWNKRAVLLHQGISAMLGSAAKALYDHGLVKSLQLSKQLPSYIPSNTFTLALLDLVAPGAKSPEEVQQAITAGKTPLDEKVKEALRPLIQAAEGKMQALRDNVEGWFNAAMDRVSSAYKKSTQTGVLIASLAVVALMDVDTIRIASALLTNEALRNATVALVDKTLDDQALQEKVRRTARPDTAPPDQPDATKQPQDINAARKDVDDSIAAVWDLGMPLGWNANAKAYFRLHPQISILGLLVTALAVSLGAPFWFDLLSKIVAVRSAVKPKDKDHPAVVSDGGGGA